MIARPGPVTQHNEDPQTARPPSFCVGTVISAKYLFPAGVRAVILTDDLSALLRAGKRDMSRRSARSDNPQESPVQSLPAGRARALPVAPAPAPAPDERHLHALIDCLGDYVWQTNEAGVYTHLSAGVTRTLGFRPEEMLGKAAFDGLAFADAAAISVLLADAEHTPRPFSMLERRVAHRDGHEVVLESCAVPIFGPDGVFQGYCGVDRDVSQGRHTQETAAQSEFQLRAILEATVEGILVADSATREFVLANEALSRMLGYGASELMALRFADLLPTGASAQDLRRFDAMLQGEIRGTEDIGIRRKDGSLLYVSIAGARLDIGGRTVAVAVFHDVDERRRADEALRASEQRFHTIFDFVTDGIIIHELETGAFVEVNRSICELLGYTREELLALDIDRLSADRSAAASQESLQYISRAVAGEPQSFEWQARAKDGHRLWIEVRLRRVAFNERDYLLSTAHHITGRKLAAEALAYRDKILRATALGTAHLVRADTFDSGILQALRTVGEALGVDRVLLIGDNPGGSMPTLHHCWEDPGVPIHLQQSAFSPGAFDPSAITAWRAPLRAGQPVVTHLREATGTIQELMTSIGSQSKLMMPILVGGEYWGNIGLDSCRAEREWQATEIQVLETFATVIGIAILRNRTRLGLERSEAQLSNALTVARAGHWEYDPEADVYTFNDNFFRIFRTTAEAVGGYRMSSAEYVRRFVHPDDAVMIGQEMRAATAKTEGDCAREFEHRTLYSGGATGHVAVRCLIERDPHGRIVRRYGVNQDITERKRVEEALRRSNRALRTLSVGNETLVRAEHEPQFLESMCRVLVDIGGYETAWIGYAEDDEARSVRVAGVAGAHREYVEQARVSWADVELGRGPTGTAIRTGKPQINADFASNPSVSAWRDAALRSGFHSNIALPLIDDGRVFGALTIYSRERDSFSEEEVRLLTEFSNDLAFGIVSLRTRLAREEGIARLRRAIFSTVQALANTVELRDPYTAGHQRRVAELARAIAAKLGHPAHTLDGIYLAALIHDIGKIRVPAEILSKPGKLSGLEHQLVKTHVQAGYEIVKAVEFPWPVADMILQHHERFDGSGYPNCLKGDAILPGARVIAVADVIEAMTAHRPYRPALGVEAALAEIGNGRGIRYDAAAVDACVALFRDEGFAFGD